MRTTPWVRPEQAIAGEGISTSRVNAYRDGNQTIPSGAETRVCLNSERFDSLGEMDISLVSGTADATEANKLHDADGGFSAADVGKWVWNTSDNTYTTVAAFVDSGELTLAANIMANGEGYTLYNSHFVATVDGYYSVMAQVMVQDVGDGKKLQCIVAINTDTLTEGILIPGAAQWCSAMAATIVHLDAGDKIALHAKHEHGSSRVLNGWAIHSFLAVHRLS